uniref:Uncharacterized protein n=1 Tax=Trypanosoma congolense (strain IL3000) TaxID=1068625 RepID=G0USJ5_TRYCI|nr:hypothetical protein, unlikely [Trypanosoma congolense IL3000]
MQVLRAIALHKRTYLTSLPYFQSHYLHLFFLALLLCIHQHCLKQLRRTNHGDHQPAGRNAAQVAQEAYKALKAPTTTHAPTLQVSEQLRNSLQRCSVPAYWHHGLIWNERFPKRVFGVSAVAD